MSLQQALKGDTEAPSLLSLCSEIADKQEARGEHFLAVRTKPDHLLKKVGRAVWQLAQLLDEVRAFSGRQDELSLYFDLIFFQRIGDDYFNDAYITTARLTEKSNNVELMLYCLDAAQHLTSCYSNRFATVFFSATLTPLPYYESLLKNDSREFPADRLVLGSPFPAENRLVVACSAWSIRYRDRERTLSDVISFLLDVVARRRGNYLIFLPSYNYLYRTKILLRNMEHPSEIEFMMQSPNMDDRQKQRFLDRFNEFGLKTLVAFAVMGSLFNEGIDLKGEKLSGVLIVGAGLPRISPEREIMCGYYASVFGRGYEYGYVFPGFNRVQQAAGRLIRDEKDQGIVVLIDDRYSKSEYRALLPDDWNTRLHDNPQDALDDIDNFWEDRGLL